MGRRRRPVQVAPRRATQAPPRGPINAPAPYRDRDTGKTTVDAMDVLRHQAAVQALEAAASQGYRPPVATSPALLGLGGTPSPLSGGLGSPGVGFIFSTGLLGQIFNPNDNGTASFIQIPSGSVGTTSVHDSRPAGYSPTSVGGPGFRLK